MKRQRCLLKAVAAEADPANLRVLFASGVSTPAQFESGSGTRGKLVFVIPAGVPAGNTQQSFDRHNEPATGGLDHVH